MATIVETQEVAVCQGCIMAHFYDEGDTADVAIGFRDTIGAEDYSVVLLSHEPYHRDHFGAGCDICNGKPGDVYDANLHAWGE